MYIIHHKSINNIVIERNGRKGAQTVPEFIYYDITTYDKRQRRHQQPQQQRQMRCWQWLLLPPLLLYTAQKQQRYEILIALICRNGFELMEY